MVDEKVLLALAVDDHHVNRMVLSAYASVYNWQLDEAASGAEAIAAANALAYDLIFMDIRMPGLDGYETVRRIRAEGGLSARTPIIAVSAEPELQAWPLAREAGMDAYIEKPVKADVLLAKVTEVLDAKAR